MTARFAGQPYLFHLNTSKETACRGNLNRTVVRSFSNRTICGAPSKANCPAFSSCAYCSGDGCGDVFHRISSSARLGGFGQLKDASACKSTKEFPGSSLQSPVTGRFGSGDFGRGVGEQFQHWPVGSCRSVLRCCADDRKVNETVRASVEFRQFPHPWHRHEEVQPRKLQSLRPLRAWRPPRIPSRRPNA